MRNLKLTLAVAAVIVLGVLGFEHVAMTVRVQAQQAGTLGDFVLYAGVRRDTDKNQSFIFHNPKTEDIWVYEDAKVTDHYRLRTIGQDLEKLNVER